MKVETLVVLVGGDNIKAIRELDDLKGKIQASSRAGDHSLCSKMASMDYGRDENRTQDMFRDR